MKKILLLLFIIISNSTTAQVDLTISDLPIIVINTKGTIYDDPKVEGEMTIFWNTDGKPNNISDLNPHFKGKIGIELRGSSSQIWPKKPYGIELWDDKKLPFKVELLGMSKESDWVFFASYNERSLMHNVLAQKIARLSGLSGSKTRYCELILNSSYQGVYVFMEKIKQGKGRVDIADMSTKDLSGDALTGGYIIKVDKSTGSNNAGGWSSEISNYGNNALTYFQYDYPKEIQSEQRRYIRGYVKDFETALMSVSFSDKEKGYAKYIDMSSFAKFLLINEISRNVDGYRISSFLYKDKDSKGGKLTAGPAWDFDLTFGNADYCDGWKTTGWAYDFNYVCPQDGAGVPFWWQRMLKDPNFVKVLADEYKKIRTGFLSDKNSKLMIDSLQSELSSAQVRNFQRWNRLGQDDWPIPRPVATTWLGEVQQLRTWLQNRLDWLDNNLPKSYAIGEALSSEIDDFITTEVYPNPIINRVFVKLKTPAPEDIQLEILSINGQLLGEIKIKTTEGENTIEVPANLIDNINSISILRIKTKNKTYNKRLIKL